MKVQNKEFCTKYCFVACSNHLPEKVQSPCRPITPYIRSHTLEFIKKKNLYSLSVKKKKRKEKKGELNRLADNLIAFLVKNFVYWQKVFTVVLWELTCVKSSLFGLHTENGTLAEAWPEGGTRGGDLHWPCCCMLVFWCVTNNTV